MATLFIIVTEGFPSPPEEEEEGWLAAGRGRDC